MDIYNEAYVEIVCTDIYDKMKKYIQHGNTTCYDHCLDVAKCSYLLAIKYNETHKKQLDVKSIVRAAFLHDFFLYDWHHKALTFKFWKMHGFTHADEALANAKKYFAINDIEQDIIYCHMWPLTILRFPKYKESYIVIKADKLCALKETTKKRQ